MMQRWMPYGSTIAMVSAMAVITLAWGATPKTDGDAVLAETRERLAHQETALGKEHPETVPILLELADYLQYQKLEFAQADALYQRATAIANKVEGGAQPLLADILLKRGDLKRSIADHAEAERLYGQALGLYRQAHGSRHPSVMETFSRLGKIHKQLGDRAQAETYYTQAYELAKELDGPTSERVADKLDGLAGLNSENGLLDAAEAQYKRAYAIRQLVHHADPEAPALASSLLNLAGLSRKKGEYRQAEEFAQKALAIRQKASGADSVPVAHALVQLADIDAERGDWGSALRRYGAAEGVFRKVYGDRHPEVANVLSSESYAHYSLGDQKSARQLAEQALAIRERVYGPNHPQVAVSLNQLGLALTESGEHDQAKALFQRAYRISTHVYGSEHDETVTHLLNLGWLLNRQGNQEEAKDMLTRVLLLRQKTVGENHPDAGIAWQHLARNAVARKDYPAAHKHYLSALAIFTAAGMNDRTASVLNSLRQILEMEGKPDAAIFFGKWAVNMTQKLRGGLDRQLEQVFLSDRQQVYREVADLMIREGRLAEAQQVLAMLKQSEYRDFIRGDERDAASRQTDLTEEEQGWGNRYQEMGKEITRIATELRAMPATSARKGAPERKMVLEAALAQARAQFEHNFNLLLSEVEQQTARRAMEIGEKNLKWLHTKQGSLQALGGKAVLLNYLVLPEHIHIILTTPHTQIARQVPIKQSELNLLVAGLRENLADRHADPLPLAQKLYQLLIRPVIQDIEGAGATTLMFSLDGGLRYLPFAALQDGNRYLIERYTTILFTQGRSASLNPSRNLRVAGFGTSHAIEGYSPLPSVDDELRAIVRIPPKKTGVLPGRMRLNEDFNAKSLRQDITQRYPVVHIASHFEFRPGTEKDSFLLLGDGTPLTLEKFRLGYDLTGVDVLTLSACETGVGGGRLANGREVEGLAVLAQERGANSVLSTLWPVADESTARLMKAFYWNLGKGHKNKAEALRSAQLTLLRGAGDALGVRAGKHDPAEGGAAGSRYAHPFYWAPFILSGNWL